MNGVSIVILFGLFAFLVVLDIAVLLGHVVALPLLTSEFSLFSFFLFSSDSFLLDSLQQFLSLFIFGAFSRPFECKILGLFANILFMLFKLGHHVIDNLFVFLREVFFRLSISDLSVE